MAFRMIGANDVGPDITSSMQGNGRCSEFKLSRKKGMEIPVRKIYQPDSREVLFLCSNGVLPQNHGRAYLPDGS